MTGKERKPMWEIREQADPALLELYIYGDVEGDSYEFWTGAKIESETSANHFRAELAKHPEAKQINIYINSYGGSVFEGTAIYNQLKRHPAHKTVYIDGFACSIASVIAMAGDEVVMPRNALMMIHNMWMVACGNAAELRKAADDLEIINEAGRAAYLAKSGGKVSAETLAEMMDDEMWLKADTCIELGFADRYADDDADMSSAADVLEKAQLDAKQRKRSSDSLAACLRELKAPETSKPEPIKKEAKSNILSLFKNF